jgi:hypothetical protein
MQESAAKGHKNEQRENESHDPVAARSPRKHFTLEARWHTPAG